MSKKKIVDGVLDITNKAGGAQAGLYNPTDEVVAGPSAEEVAKSKDGKIAIGIIIGIIAFMLVGGVAAVILL